MTMQKDPEERKAEIIQTAKHIFSEKGYKATQVKDIVSEIGVAQGLFYYYFKSKEEVMEAVAEDYANKIIDKINFLVDSQDKPIEKIFKIFDIFINSAKMESSLFFEIQSANNGVIHDKVFMYVGKKLIPLVSVIADDGVREGEFDCEYPKQTSQILVSGIFKILSDIPAEEKIDYLTNNLKIIKNIIIKNFGYKSEGEKYE